MSLRAFGQTKFCPSCQTEVPITDFYLIARGGKRVPAPYCKACMKAKAKVQHQRRRMLAMMTPEEKARALSQTCACCGKPARNRPVLRPERARILGGWRLCKDCAAVVEDFDWDAAKATAMWIQLRGHIKAVEKAKLTWRATTQPRQGWHELVPDSPPWPHAMCEPFEATWRRVMNFLTKIKDDLTR